MQQSMTMKTLAFLFPMFCNIFGAYITTGDPTMLQMAMVLWNAVYSCIGFAAIYDYDTKVSSRTYFLRADLMMPKEAPYYKVLTTGNDHAYLQLLRTNKFIFDRIMQHVREDFKLWRLGFYPDHSPRPGPVNMLDAPAVIALTLAYLGSTTQARLLELVFGVGHAVLSRDLHEGLVELLHALKLMEETEPTIPNAANMARFADAIEAEHGPCPYPGVRVWSFLDGLRLLAKEPSDSDLQTLFYNGWTHTVGIVNSLLFTPDGKICMAVVNVPGSQHDYSISHSIFAALASPALAAGGFVSAADSAFCSAHTNTFIAAKEGAFYVVLMLRLSQFCSLSKHHCTPPPLSDFVPPPASVDPLNPGSQKRRFNVWIQAVRQSVEHGMRSFQSLYCRIKTALPADAASRQQILSICLRLHNLNAHFLANHNQVTTQYLDGMLR